MTDETLRKANFVNDQIKELQAKREHLLSSEKLCWGNTGDVRERIFRVAISERGSTRDTAVCISADSAKAALDREIEEIRKKIKVLQEEFSQL